MTDLGKDCDVCKFLSLFRDKCKKEHKISHKGGCRECGIPMRTEILLGWGSDKMKVCPDFEYSDNIASERG